MNSGYVLELLLTELVDELGVVCGTKRGMKDEVFSLNNLVVFPFTGMGKTGENQFMEKIKSFI